MDGLAALFVLVCLVLVFAFMVSVAGNLSRWREEARKRHEEMRNIMNELMVSLRTSGNAGPLPAEDLTPEERMQTIDELREAGKIDAVEHHKLRKKILGGL